MPTDFRQRLRIEVLGAAVMALPLALAAIYLLVPYLFALQDLTGLALIGPTGPATAVIVTVYLVIGGSLSVLIHWLRKYLSSRRSGSA